MFEGYGYAPCFVEGDDPAQMHQIDGTALDQAVARIREIQADARAQVSAERPRWPMIVLRSPKGWTGPATVDGKQIEGTFASHQVPVAQLATDPEHLRCWNNGCAAIVRRSCSTSRPVAAGCGGAGAGGIARMGANPHANGGMLLRDLALPDFRSYAIELPMPGAVQAESTAIQGRFLRDVLKLNREAANFRIFSPDETSSNRWGAVFEVTNRCSTAESPRFGRPCVAGRQGDGDAERASMPGLAGRLPADRTPRLLFLLRGLHPHHRLHVQPACEVARRHAATSPGADRWRR